MDKKVCRSAFGALFLIHFPTSKFDTAYSAAPSAFVSLQHIITHFPKKIVLSVKKPSKH